MSEVISPKVIEWRDRIVFAATKGIECILGTCKLVAAADKDLKGDFKQLVEMLPWKASYTSLLRKVGYDVRLFDMSNQLPQDVRTLYHLSRLGDERFERLVTDGVIRPDMKRNEASAETRKERKGEDEARVLSLSRPLLRNSPHSLSIRPGTMGGCQLMANGQRLTVARR